MGSNILSFKINNFPMFVRLRDKLYCLAMTKKEDTHQTLRLADPKALKYVLGVDLSQIQVQQSHIFQLHPHYPDPLFALCGRLATGDD